MGELQKIYCPSCDKLLCEANGEVKKICPKCKTVIHVVATSLGTYYVSGLDISSEPDKTGIKFTKIE